MRPNLSWINASFRVDNHITEDIFKKKIEKLNTEEFVLTDYKNDVFLWKNEGNDYDPDVNTIHAYFFSDEYMSHKKFDEIVSPLRNSIRLSEYTMRLIQDRDKPKPIKPAGSPCDANKYFVNNVGMMADWDVSFEEIERYVSLSSYCPDKRFYLYASPIEIVVWHERGFHLTEHVGVSFYFYVMEGDPRFGGWKSTYDSWCDHDFMGWGKKVTAWGEKPYKGKLTDTVSGVRTLLDRTAPFSGELPKYQLAYDSYLLRKDNNER